ncbi:MAG: hypothetical protein U9R68_10375, partial [Planctomycetota bacterium]|nr:hypothetical protein [Planctomycetota bacterium]
RLQAFQHGTKPAAEKLSETATRLEAKPAGGAPSEAAGLKPAVQGPPAAEAWQRITLLAIPPNQVMLVVRVRSAAEPSHAAEAVQTEVEPAEPAKAKAEQRRDAPAAKE